MELKYITLLTTKTIFTSDLHVSWPHVHIMEWLCLCLWQPYILDTPVWLVWSPTIDVDMANYIIIIIYITSIIIGNICFLLSHQTNIYQNKWPHILTTASFAVSRQILHSNILSSFSFSSVEPDGLDGPACSLVLLISRGS